jgi:hypothetical protein
VTEVVCVVADPGITLSDAIRWIGVAVAVAGVVLATPDAIPSGWRSTANWLANRRREANELARRLLRRPVTRVGAGQTSISITSTCTGRRVWEWSAWPEDAGTDGKIAVLHQHADELRNHLDGLDATLTTNVVTLRGEIGEAESRLEGRIQKLVSEINGERSRASHVDARGFGPIALGVILTGIPDELAKILAVGAIVTAIAVSWTVGAIPGWWRDFSQALGENRRDREAVVR